MKRDPIPDDPLRAMLHPRPQPAAAATPSTAENLRPPQATPPLPAAPLLLPSPTPPASAGPLGGVSTITTAGKLRKTLYFPPELWQQIQDRCRKEHLSYTVLIETAIRRHLGI